MIIYVCFNTKTSRVLRCSRLVTAIVSSIYNRWDHFEVDKSLDFPNSKGEPWPPLLLNWPRKAIISFSWLALSSFSMLLYLRLIRPYSLPRSLFCSSNPVLIFFWSAASSAACLALKELQAVSILRLRAFSQASFSLFSSSWRRSCTLWASVYLHERIDTIFVWPCAPPFFWGWETTSSPWLYRVVVFPCHFWGFLDHFDAWPVSPW